jgi:hypothetical protein
MYRRWATEVIFQFDFQKQNANAQTLTCCHEKKN